MGLTGLVAAATKAAPLIGAAALGAGVAGAFGGGGPDIPASATAARTKPAKTAARVEPVSDSDRKKKRLQASFLTKGFVTPKLSKPGLLGLDV